MTDRERIEKLKPLDFGRYENVDLDRLFMYTMGQLQQIGVDLSFYNAVVAAFKLFPKKFSIPGFPSYPDAKRGYDCLFRCTFKTKRWLEGRIRQGFTLTDRSRMIIREAERRLSGESPKRLKAASQTRRKERVLSEAELSPAYSKYTNGQAASITEGDFCYLLQGTLDTSPRILRENLASLKNHAEELSKNDMVKFLKWAEKRFRNLLKETRR